MATAEPNPSIQALISDFAKSALERSKEMSEEEFERTVKEPHEIVDRRASPSRLRAQRRAEREQRRANREKRHL
jgi:hypothetical protein